MRADRSPRSTRARVGSTIATAAAAAIALTSCFTGERPTLAEGPEMTGDPAIDAVLERLDRAPEATFTAGYDVLVRYGDVRRPATVVQADEGRRSITVGDIRFIVDGRTTATCELSTGTCSDTLDQHRISDTMLSADFYASSAAARLRQVAGSRTDAATGSTVDIAGVPAACVAIPLTSTTETYCALDAGPLARLEGADVHVELTSYSFSPDEAAFAATNS